MSRRRGSHRPQRHADQAVSGLRRTGDRDAVTDAVDDALKASAGVLMEQAGLTGREAPFVLTSAVELPDGSVQSHYLAYPAEPLPHRAIEATRDSLANIGEGDSHVDAHDVTALVGAVVREVRCSESEVVVVFGDGREMAVTASADFDANVLMECEVRRRVLGESGDDSAARGENT